MYKRREFPNEMDVLCELGNADNADLIGLSETWISSQFTNQELAILWMLLFHNDRKTVIEDGVALYL